MADIFSKSKRSQIMSSIRSQETKPEITVRKYLFFNNLRYRKNYKKLPGKPDIVLPKFKSVVFIHGCFWHGHKNCKAASLPKTRTGFWREKIQTNIDRDQLNKLALKKLGWNVFTVWQCEIKNSKKKEKRLIRLVKQIKTE